MLGPPGRYIPRGDVGTMSGTSGWRPPLEMSHALLDWAPSAYVVLLALADDVVPARQVLLVASYDQVPCCGQLGQRLCPIDR
eukprot:6039964-Pyramimonas_sp.AAC.1